MVMAGMTLMMLLVLLVPQEAWNQDLQLDAMSGSGTCKNTKAKAYPCLTLVTW